MTDIVERLRSNEPLPACPFDRISPRYLKMPDDKPCPFCGQENTLDGPDKCRGADTSIMGEAASEIERLRVLLNETEGGLLLLRQALRADDPRDEIIFRIDEELRQIRRRALSPLPPSHRGVDK